MAEIEKQFTRLEAGVASLKRVQVALKRYRASVLKAACEGRLVPTEAELARRESRSYEPATTLLARILAERRNMWNGRGKYKEPVTIETTDLDPLPEDWSWVTWDTILAPGDGAFKRGPFGSALTKSNSSRPASKFTNSIAQSTMTAHSDATTSPPKSSKS